MCLSLCLPINGRIDFDEICRVCPRAGDSLDAVSIHNYYRTPLVKPDEVLEQGFWDLRRRFVFI